MINFKIATRVRFENGRTMLPRTSKLHTFGSRGETNKMPFQKGPKTLLHLLGRRNPFITRSTSSLLTRTPCKSRFQTRVFIPFPANRMCPAGSLPRRPRRKLNNDSLALTTQHRRKRSKAAVGAEHEHRARPGDVKCLNSNNVKRTNQVGREKPRGARDEHARDHPSPIQRYQRRYDSLVGSFNIRHLKCAYALGTLGNLRGRTKATRMAAARRFSFFQNSHETSAQTITSSHMSTEKSASWDAWYDDYVTAVTMNDMLCTIIQDGKASSIHL